MRRSFGIPLAAALAATFLAGAATAQISNGTVTGSSGGAGCGCVPPGEQGADDRGVLPGRGGEVPTRYEASLLVLKAQIDRQARLDGGELTFKHQAQFERALDDTNRYFHKGRYAR